MLKQSKELKEHRCLMRKGTDSGLSVGSAADRLRTQATNASAHRKKFQLTEQIRGHMSAFPQNSRFNRNLKCLISCARLANRRNLKHLIGQQWMDQAQVRGSVSPWADGLQ